MYSLSVSNKKTREPYDLSKPTISKNVFLKSQIPEI